MFTEREKNFLLKPHQEKIYNNLKIIKIKNYIPERLGLFLSPGAGKTFLTKKICELFNYEKNDIFVISPLSAVRDSVWEGVHNIHFALVERFFNYNTTFENALSLYLEKNKLNKKNLVLIIDEAHVLKNINTRIRQLIKRIIPIAKTTIFLSGTPGGRNEYEFFNLVNLCFSQKDAMFLEAKNFGPFYDVTSKFKGIDLLPPIRLKDTKDRKSLKKGIDIVKISNNEYVIKDMELWYQTNINNRTGLSLVETYFTSKINMFTPTPTIEYINFKNKYKKYILDFIKKRIFVFTVGESDIDFDYSNFKNEIIKISKDNNPLSISENKRAAILKRGHLSLLNYQYAHCKIKEIINIIKNNRDKQVIIWSSFIAERDVLQEYLKDFNIKIATKENIEEFKKNNIKGIIASAYSEKEAHTWNNCSLNIYFNPNTSSVAFSQNRFRTNRIGQKEKVLYYFLYFTEETETLKLMLNSYIRNKNSLEIN